jgi:energy-coupling factor transport system permease protein
MFATFKYFPGNTVIHRLDPRTKLLMVALLTIGTIVVDDIRVLAGLMAIGLIYYGLARLALRDTWKAWAVVLFFSIVLIGLFSTTLFGRTPPEVTSAHTWFAFPPITLPFFGTIQRVVTWEIAMVGLGRAVRPLIIMTAILPFTFTTDPYLYGVAFRRLGLPDGTAFALDLALRYVPTFARDYFITVDAQRARGYELEARAAGTINMIRRAAPLIVPVTINAIAGGEDVVDAMDLRAFGIGPRTWTYEDQLGYKSSDYTVLIFFTALVVLITVLRLLTPIGPFWFPAWLFP